MDVFLWGHGLGYTVFCFPACGCCSSLSLNSFGIPYLYPYAACVGSGQEEKKDSLIRYPFRQLKYRPVFARKAGKNKTPKEG